MKVTNIKKYHFQKETTTINDEGTKTTSFEGAEKVPFFAYIYPMDTRKDGEVYGQRINSMLRLMTNDKRLELGLGICYKKETADYKVTVLNEYTEHFEAIIEKL